MPVVESAISVEVSTTSLSIPVGSITAPPVTAVVALSDELAGNAACRARSKASHLSSSSAQRARNSSIMLDAVSSAGVGGGGSGLAS